MVFWVCKQIEGAVMRSKNVANEQKTEALALGLGREKRSEEILRYSRRDAMTIVGDGERSWRGVSRRPRPWPWGLVEKNGVKRFFAIAGGMP